MGVPYQRLGPSYFAVASLLIGVSAGAVAGEKLSAIKVEGSTKLIERVSGGNVVHLEIRQAKLDISFPYKGALLWGGDVDELPQTVLTSIQISKNEKALFIPLSAYGDLGDIKFASLEPTKKGFALHLHGGNTATGYDATLVFSHGYLESRLVRLREFPDDRWEKARYSFTK
jgi:hypothetical protein